MVRSNSRNTRTPVVDQDDFYTVAEATNRLKLSRSTLWRWIQSGRLPAYRVGAKAIRLRKADVQALMQPARPRRREVTPTTERTPASTALDVPPLTDDEVQRTLQVLEEIDALQEKMLRRRGGQPFPSSVELIREMREERDRQLDQR